MKFNYTVTTHTIWTSFDSGEVEADTREEAKKKAIEQVTYDFEKANEVLAASDNTIGFRVDFDKTQVELTEIK